MSKRRIAPSPRLSRATRAAVALASVTLAMLFGTAGCIVGMAITLPERNRPEPVATLPRSRVTVKFADLAPAAPLRITALEEWLSLQPVPLPDWRAIELAAKDPAPGAASFRPMFRDAALRQSLSPELVEAIARVESDLNPYEVSEKGALGLLQVMPETGKRFGVPRERLFDPRSNIAAGTAYLAWLLDRYHGNLDLALAAYNAGEGAVDQHGGIPPYRETQQYVKRVRAALRAISRG